MVTFQFLEGVLVLEEGGGVEGDFAIEGVDGTESVGLLEGVGVEDEFGAVVGEEERSGHDHVVLVGDFVCFGLFDVADEDPVVRPSTVPFPVIIHKLFAALAPGPQAPHLLRPHPRHIRPAVPVPAPAGLPKQRILHQSFMQALVNHPTPPAALHLHPGRFLKVSQRQWL